MRSSEDVRRLVIDWLDDNYHFGEAEQKIKDDDMSLLTTGILDSLGFVKLILHLEDSLGLKIDRHDLNRDNFDSLRKVVAYVTSHRDFAGRAAS